MARKKKTDEETPEAIPASSLTVDQYLVADPRVQPTQGAFVDVVAGEHAGRYGGYVRTLTTKLNEDGVSVPDQIIVKTRDDRHEELSVAWEDTRTAPPRGRQ